MHRISPAHVTSVLLWAIIGFAAWYLAAHPYERLLGSIAWDFFPQKEVFLALKDHVFSIGLTGGGDTPLPQLTLISHNFGFGLVVTGSVLGFDFNVFAFGTVFIEFVAQGTDADAQNLRRLGTVTPGFPQGFENELLLGFLH